MQIKIKIQDTCLQWMETIGGNLNEGGLHVMMCVCEDRHVCTTIKGRKIITKHTKRIITRYT
jgi:hypothetical protein